MIGKSYSKFIKSISRLLAMILLVLMTSTSLVMAAGEDTEVLIEIDRDSIQMGGVSTQVSLILRNPDGKAEIVSFGGGLDEFEVVSTKQTNSTSMVNGVTVKEIGVIYTLKAKEVGPKTLKAVIKVGDDLYESNIAKITVTERDASFDETAEEVFIRTVVADEEIYLGEKAVITYELYSMHNLADFAFLNSIMVDGFVIESSEDGNYQPSYLTIGGGQQYVMIEVKQLVMSPTKAGGDYTIPSFDFQANIGSGGLFGNSQAVYLDTEAVDISVKQVPSDGQPVGFAGLTGVYDISASYNHNQVSEDDPLTLEVAIRGSGNLEAINSIKDYLDIDHQFTVYETDKGMTSRASITGYEATKEFELILIPKLSGELTIDGGKIPYFDSLSESYKELIIPGTQINVLPREGSGLSDSGQINNGPLIVSQVNYDEKDEDMITISVPKTVVVITFLVVIGLVIILLIGFGLRSWYLYTKDIKRGLVRKMRKASDSLELQKLFIDYVILVFDIDLRSTPVSELDGHITDKEVVAGIKYLQYFFEHDRHYNDDRFEEIKHKVIEVVNT